MWRSTKDNEKDSWKALKEREREREREREKKKNRERKRERERDCQQGTIENGRKAQQIEEQINRRRRKVGRIRIVVPLI